MTDHKQIIRLLSSFRFTLTDEKRLQSEIEERFKEADLSYRREVRLDASNIIDFMVDDVGIEVKIKGGRLAIYRQVERYVEFDEVKSLILLTNVPMGMPSIIKGKPVYVVSLAKAWL